MKKTSNARLRRTLAMIAALTMLLSGLTACKKAPVDTEEPTSSTPPTAATSAPTETTAPPETTEPKAPSVMGTVNTNNLNIRTSPASTSTIISQLDAGERVEILEQRTSDGVNWGRIEKGWISLAYVTLDGQITDEADSETKVEETNKTETPSVSGTPANTTGTITATELNIRKGPGTNYDAVAKYKKGDKVTITETKDGWGKTDKGWIKMSYVNTTSSSSSSSSTTTTTDSKYTTLVTNGSTASMGSVKITIGALNVRYGPGSSYEVVTKVLGGTSHTYYQKSGDWVRISDGWIYTKGYAEVDGASTDNSSSSTTGTTGTVTATSLFIRKEPSKSGEPVGGYKQGDVITILETKDGWGRTNKGWVSMDYVKTN